MKHFYTGIALAGIIAALAVTGCPNLAVDDPVHSISLDQTGTCVFPAAVIGYGAQTAKPVTVTNTGNQATGALTIAKSGANADSFTVSTASLASIAAGGNGSFTVVPNTGLAAGTYTAAITVSGGNSIGASFNVSFTVAASGSPAYSIGLSESGTCTFPAAAAGYGAQTAKSVTVTNTGNQATGALTIAKSGANADSFTVSATGLASIEAGGSDSFTVVPAMGLATGTYTASIAVNGENGVSASFNVSFTVAIYSVSLSETGAYTFPAAIAGYAAQTARSVTVTNTGTQATGELAIAKSGANAGSFTVSAASLSSIAVGESGSFTVLPATGLAEGTYTATIAVSGGNGISANFNVSFTVELPPYGIGLDVSGTHTFPEAVFGYAAQTAKTVTVRNAGLNATGVLAIALSEANPGSFTLDKTSTGDIAFGESDSFTVTPATGLAAGTYTASIAVSGGNGVSADFSVSFTVAAPVYSVSLSESGTYAFPVATIGYGEQTERSVTVSNTGNQDTGALTVAKSGADAASFTVSTANLAGIAVGGSDSFTVVPKTGLAAGTYTASIAVSGDNSIGASFNVSFTALPVYTVTFNASGGTPATSTAQTSSGSTVSLPASNPARSGYVFSGWYTEANGGGSVFTASTTVNGDMMVYAKWTETEPTINLDLDAGAGSFSQAAFTLSKGGGPQSRTISISGSGYTDPRWFVDGELKGTGYAITIYAADYGEGSHTLALIISKGGVSWSKELIFTVTP